MSRRRRALRVFAAALAVSILLHLALLGVPGWLPSAPDEPAVIEARLVSVPPLPPAVEPPPPPPKPAPRKRPPRRASVPPPPTPEPPPSPAVADAPAAPEPPVAPAEARGAAPATDHPAEAPEPEQPTSPAVEPPTDVLAMPEAPPLERQMPRRGRIVYAFYYGGQRFQVGQSVAEWTVDEGHYVLRSVTETTGLAGFLKRLRIVYSSEGLMTPHGLRPELFSALQESKGTRLHSARFDWDAMRLSFSGTQDPRVTPLLPESQDLLSFIHQLSLIRLPADSLFLNITNGRRLGTYEVQVLGEEMVDTPLGTMLATHLRQVPTRGEESLEVWLAAKYGNLPVRVRYTDKKGEVAGEQLAQEIWVES